MIELIEPRWTAPATVSACCTTRVGGDSEAPYDSLNLGLHVGDDEACVLRNRQRLRRELGLDTEPEWLRQTHSTRVVVLEQERGRVADAAITRAAGRAAVVMVADCLPILLCNREGSEVAAVHAGWRGLQAGVIQATLDAMCSPAADLIAWIGPAISQAHFEVGDEVRAAFAKVCAAAADYFIPSQRAGHWQCDLAGLAEWVLSARGVTRIYRDDFCSYRDRDRFYSYRRDGVCGRMAALIWID